MTKNKKDLTYLSLEELHIYKQNAFQTLAKLERLLGNVTQAASNNTYEYKDYMYFGGLYRQLEEEMNDRIVKLFEE